MQRPNTDNALVKESFFRSEEDGGGPSRQEYPVIDGPCDGRSFSGHNGVGPLFSDHSFCVLSHRFAFQQVLHIRDKRRDGCLSYKKDTHE